MIIFSNRQILTCRITILEILKILPGGEIPHYFFSQVGKDNHQETAWNFQRSLVSLSRRYNTQLRLPNSRGQFKFQRIRS